MAGIYPSTLRALIRRHVVIWTGLLTVTSLALVFAVVGGLVPSALLPRARPSLVEAIPHVNAALSILALGAIAGGIRAVRTDDVPSHRRRMGLAFALFVVFLGLYLYRIAIAGTRSFPGPSVLEPLYLLVLGVHVSLAILSLPLLYYVLLLAYGYEVSEMPATNHPRVGRVAAALWASAFALGIVVYLSLYVLFPG